MLEQFFLVLEFKLLELGPLGFIHFAVSDIIHINAGLVLDEVGNFLRAFIKRAVEEPAQKVKAALRKRGRDGRYGSRNQGYRHDISFSSLENRFGTVKGYPNCAIEL
jgi:hypothetical protein